MVVIALVVVFAAIVCLVLAVSWREEGAGMLSARLSGLRGERTPYEATGRVEGSLSARVLLPLAGSLGAKIESLLPSRWAKAIDQRLIQAGRPASLTGFLTAASLSGFAGVSFGLVLGLSAGLHGMASLALIAFPALIGFYFPRIWLENRVRSRQKEILKSLPDAFDLITICVEAGLGLEAALAKVVEKMEGAFPDELGVSLREVAMGKLRREALRELADRTGVPDLTSFINAIVQAESMGTSIATVLRVQADQMRTRRRQRAEKAAHEAPIKMMFPLVLCIFPTLMIVILGPAAIELYRQLIQR